MDSKKSPKGYVINIKIYLNSLGHLISLGFRYPYILNTPECNNNKPSPCQQYYWEYKVSLEVLTYIYTKFIYISRNFSAHRSDNNMHWINLNYLCIGCIHHKTVNSVTHKFINLRLNFQTSKVFHIFENSQFIYYT